MAALCLPLLVLSTTACSQDDGGTGGPSGGTSSAGAPPATAPSPAPRRVTVLGDVYTVDVGPLVRSGDAVVLSVRLRLDVPRDGGSTVYSGHVLADNFGHFSEPRLVDPTARVAYLPATRAGNRGCVCTRSWLHLKAGDADLAQVAFTGIPEDLGALDVMLPLLGLTPDVPVISGPVPTPPPPPSGGSGREPSPLDLSGAQRSLVADLDSFTQRLDSAVNVKRTRQETQILLDTDVLFAVDSATLSARASATLASAAKELQAAGPGPLTVTGHTDDTGTEAHNLALSRRRAKAVAAALARQFPSSRWPQTVLGRGEEEPLVPNTSADRRRLNRRVTVSYRSRAEKTMTRSTDPTSPARLPATRGVVGTVDGGAVVDLPSGRGTLRVTPGTVTSRGEYLVVELRLRNEGTETLTNAIWDYFGQKAITVQGEFQPAEQYSASGVRLLAGGVAYYPVTVERAADDHECLCERSLNIKSIPPGAERSLTIWYTRPPGTTSIVIDLPDRLRIPDVPLP